MNNKIETVHKKLIVSCQALPEEPLHSSFIMGRMALAAKEGGAAGIRANTKEDIAELAQVSADNIKTVTGKDGKITKVVYENDGKQCTYQLEGNDTDGYDLTSKGTYTVK